MGYPQSNLTRTATREEKATRHILVDEVRMGI